MPHSHRLPKLLTVAAITIGLLGCSTEDTQTLPTSLVKDPLPIAVEPKSATELLAMLEATMKDITTTAKLYQSAGGSFRIRRVEALVGEGIDLADALLVSDDAQVTQVTRTRQLKVELLLKAVDLGFDGYKEKLAAYSIQLREDAPNSDEAAMMTAIGIEQLWKDQAQSPDYETVMNVLQKHGQQFPNHVTTPALYYGFAQSLMQEQRFPELRHCLQTALAAVGDMPESARLSNMLAGIKAAERRHGAQQARLNQLKSRVGGRSNGSFVLYAHPKRIGRFTRIDYEVCTGLQALANYTQDIPENWVWELKGWFPEGREGRIQANALRTKLVKENAIEVMTWSKQ